jgi:hypothetical protein
MILCWTLVLDFVGGLMTVLVQMDRNELLTRIGTVNAKDASGAVHRVTFDRAFVGTMLTYVVLPVLGLLATQFPEVGGLFGVIQPLLRILK